MSNITYSITFRGDGTYDSSPTPVTITPGTTVTFYGRAESDDMGYETNLDLTGARLVCVLFETGGPIRFYQEDSPSFFVTSPQNGRFTLVFDYKLTQLLRPVAHTLEIKAIYPNETRRQICYLPILISPSSLVSE